jgi:hypothetical protein
MRHDVTRLQSLDSAVFKATTDFAPDIGTEKIQIVTPIPADQRIALPAEALRGAEVSDSSIESQEERVQFVCAWVYESVVRKAEVETAMDVVPIRALGLDHPVPKTLKEIRHS